MKTAILLMICAGPVPLVASGSADVLFLKDGSTRTGRVVAASEDAVRIRTRLQHGEIEVAERRSRVEKVEFAADGPMEALVSGGPEDQGRLSAAWRDGGQFLDLPRSAVARVGLRLSELLVKQPGKAGDALLILRRIEAAAWDEDDRRRAKVARLRVLLAQGQASEVLAEAEQLAQSEDTPEILVAARLILADARAFELQELLKENPRWEEDPFIKPERDRLHHEALDHYLYPPLFHGALAEAAARGLAGAQRLLCDAGQIEQARWLAEDIVTMYAATPEAAAAGEFLKNHTKPTHENPETK